MPPWRNPKSLWTLYSVNLKVLNYRKCEYLFQDITVISRFHCISLQTAEASNTDVLVYVSSGIAVVVILFIFIKYLSNK